ncbi:CD209 antigen-like [Centropristis striata]|uniref:CD209 antigen-like n=1 Tax=Centropristis striata TaxID=184440 RepID=UPI0027E030C6|nr:CD209 antigen-like [Centropristis striata]
MVKGEMTGCNFQGGFSSLIYEGDSQDTDQPPYPNPTQDTQKVPTYSRTLWSHSRLATVSLALLAAVLLVVDISLGVHFAGHKLTETNHTLNDTEFINNELSKLQDACKTATENTNSAKKQLERVMSRQKPADWELEHQKRRSKVYEVQLDKLTKELAWLRYTSPMIISGCRSCPIGWILMNSVCYYFHFSNSDGKSWQDARDYCKLFGGDLAIIDSKDKENATINHLMNNKYRYSSYGAAGFWIGVRNFPKEETWKWVDGRALVQGYWNDDEPNNNSNKECGVVLAKENFFKAWNDVNCDYPQRWICEKAPRSMS